MRLTTSVLRRKLKKNTFKSGVQKTGITGILKMTVAILHLALVKINLKIFGPAWFWQSAPAELLLSRMELAQSGVKVLKIFSLPLKLQTTRLARVG